MADTTGVENRLQLEVSVRKDVRGDPVGGPDLVVKLTGLKASSPGSGRVRIWQSFAPKDGMEPLGAPALEFPRSVLPALLEALAELNDAELLDRASEDVVLKVDR